MARRFENLNSVFFVFCRVLAFGACVAGFTWLCWGQVDKFLSEKTTVTVSWSKNKSLPFPIIVFCNQDAFDDFYPTFISEGNYFPHLSLATQTLLLC